MTRGFMRRAPLSVAALASFVTPLNLSAQSSRDHLPQHEIMRFNVPHRLFNGDLVTDRGSLKYDWCTMGCQPAHVSFYHMGEVERSTVSAWAKAGAIFNRHIAEEGATSDIYVTVNISNTPIARLIEASIDGVNLVSLHGANAGEAE